MAGLQLIPRIKVRKVVFFGCLMAGVGFLIPGTPVYLPVMLAHYIHFQDGHSLGYWMRALDRPDQEERLRAIKALGALGPDAAEAVPALARILTDDADDHARHQAALALSKMAPASASAVPALARALEKDDVAVVRMDSALALSKLGPQARSAAPVMIRAMQNKSNRTNLNKMPFTIQEISATALGRATAGTSEGVAALTEALRDARTINKRCILARALGEVGAPAREAEPQLEALLKDENDDVRVAAKAALQKIHGE